MGDRSISKASELFFLSLSILNDECPPDNECYLCKMGCMAECESPCSQCWENYLLWVVNGKIPEKKPYRHDVIIEGLGELCRHTNVEEPDLVPYVSKDLAKH